MVLDTVAGPVVAYSGVDDPPVIEVPYVVGKESTLPGPVIRQRKFEAGPFVASVLQLSADHDPVPLPWIELVGLLAGARDRGGQSLGMKWTGRRWRAGNRPPHRSGQCTAGDALTTAISTGCSSSSNTLPATAVQSCARTDRDTRKKMVGKKTRHKCNIVANAMRRYTILKAGK